MPGMTTRFTTHIPSQQELNPLNIRFPLPDIPRSREVPRMPNVYKNPWDGFKSVLRTEGPRRASIFAYRNLPHYQIPIAFEYLEKFGYLKFVPRPIIEALGIQNRVHRSSVYYR